MIVRSLIANLLRYHPSTAFLVPGKPCGICLGTHACRISLSRTCLLENIFKEPFPPRSGAECAEEARLEFSDYWLQEVPHKCLHLAQHGIIQVPYGAQLQ